MHVFLKAVHSLVSGPGPKPGAIPLHGCTSRGLPGSKINFFRFPSAKRDPQLLAAWMRAVRGPDCCLKYCDPQAAMKAFIGDSLGVFVDPGAVVQPFATIKKPPGT